MARPVLAGPSPWHRDHAFADFCAVCHGGDPQAADEPTAHLGLVSPLADVNTTCGPCHADASQLATRYAAQPENPPRSAHAPQLAAQTPRVVWANVALASLVLIVGGGGAAYVVRNERRLRGGKP